MWHRTSSKRCHGRQSMSLISERHPGSGGGNSEGRRGRKPIHFGPLSRTDRHLKSRLTSWCKTPVIWMQLKASVAGVAYLLYIEGTVNQNIVAWKHIPSKHGDGDTLTEPFGYQMTLKSIPKLEGNIRLLTFCQSTNSSDSSNRLFALWQTHDTASHQPSKPVFMASLERDETSVRRKDILDSID